MAKSARLTITGHPISLRFRPPCRTENPKSLIFFAFDLLFADTEDLRPLPLSARKARLAEVLKPAKNDRHSAFRGALHQRRRGGAAIGLPDEPGRHCLQAAGCALSRRPRRQLDQVQMSRRPRSGDRRLEHDGRQIPLPPGGLHRGGHLIYVGRVGTGYSAAKVKQLMPRLKEMAAETSPFAGENAPKQERGVHWLKPELVAEIEFAGWTGDGMVRQAAFKGLRADKPAKDVEAETPKMRKTVAEPRAKKAPKAIRQRGDEHSHHPSRQGAMAGCGRRQAGNQAGSGAIFRSCRRLDAAAYQGPALLAGARARRHQAKERFFQRHAGPGQSSLFTQVKVSGDRKPYLQIDRVEALAAVAQAGGLELHPWNCAPGQPGHAGTLCLRSRSLARPGFR